MSLTTRDDKTSGQAKTIAAPRSFPAGFDIYRRYGYALSNTWIVATDSRSYFIADLEGKTASNGDVPVYWLAKVNAHPSFFCVSQDRQLLADLTPFGFRVMYLDGMTKVNDRDKVRTENFVNNGLPLSQKNIYDVAMFFINNQSHVVVWSFLSSTIGIIDVNTGKVTQKELSRPESVCAFGANKLVSAHKDQGLFVHELNFSGDEITLSKPQLLTTEPYCDYRSCVVSPDGRFLAARCIQEFTQHYMKLWAIKPDGKIELQQSGLSCKKNPQFEPFFTCDSTLVYQSAADGVSILEYDSGIPQTYNETNGTKACIDLPDGNVMQANNYNHFSIIPCKAARPVFQQAFADMMRTIEVGAAVPVFSGDVAKIVSGYASESRFFYRPKQVRHVDDLPFQRSILIKTLEGLLNEPDVKSFDKDKMRLLKLALEKYGIEECVIDLLNASGISMGLKEFLENVQQTFASVIQQKSAKELSS